MKTNGLNFWLLVAILGIIPSFQQDAAAMSSPPRAPFHIGTPLAPASQHMSWETLAGYPGAAGFADGPGISARFSYPLGIAADSSGITYVADSGNQVIRRISADGMVSTIAGQVGSAGWADGVATNALFNNPNNLAFGPDGSLYICDSGNQVVRRLSPSGVVSTIAGAIGVSGYQDGMGTNALFNWPSGLAVDTNGNAYVTDGNYAVRKISSSGLVSTLAGQPWNNGYKDGHGTNALFSNLNGLAVDASGAIYLADSGNYLIRKITPAGTVTTWAGQAGVSAYQDGNGTNATFSWPRCLGVDQQGNLYVAGNACIRKISADAEVTTLGGGSRWSDHLDAVGPFAWFNSVSASAVDATGHLLVVDSSDHTIRYGCAATEPRPRILTQPKGATISLKANFTLEVEALSTAPLSYQWFLNAQPIAGATSAQLKLQSVTESDAGQYRVVVSGGVAYVLSFPANVQVMPPTSVNNTPLDNWRRMAGSPLQNIHGLAYGNGRYVAVGEGNPWSQPYNGAVATSTDGEHWVKQLPIASESLNGLAFGAGTFVVVGDKATVLTSSDGLTWQPQILSSEGMPDLHGITFAQKMFVAVSGNTQGSIWTSADGISWVNRGADFGVSLMTVAAAGDQLVALGNTILTSTNGIVWAPAGVPTNYLAKQVLLEHIACGSGSLLASEHWGNGFLAASSNGLDWQDVAPTNGTSFAQVTYGAGKFIANDTYSGGVCASTNGLDWSVPVMVTNNQREISSPHLRFDHGLFVASGYEGALFTSADGVSWALRQQATAIPFVPTSLIRVGEQYWAGGGDLGLAVSDNGSDWNLVLPTNSFSGLAYGGGTLVAAGGNDIIVTSQDGGTTWTDRSPRFSYGSASPWLSRVVFGEGVFVALGSMSYYNGTQTVQWSHLLASTNGVNWVQSSLDQQSFSLIDVVYGNGAFVVTESSDVYRIFVSTNGVSWKAVSPNPTNYPSSVAFGNQRFVLATGQGYVLISSDGLTWHQHSLQGDYGLNKLVFGNGVFLASGWSSTSSRPILLSSVDGLAWTQHAAPPGYFSLLTATDGAFFITGEDNSLYQSAALEWLSNARWIPPTQFEWEIAGALRANYRIEVSEDLRTWRIFNHVTNAQAVSKFVDQTSGQAPARFYRAVTE